MTCPARKGLRRCHQAASHDGPHIDELGQWRAPLVHRELTAEEAERMNPDLTPKNATEAERTAAVIVPPYPPEDPTMTPDASAPLPWLPARVLEVAKLVAAVTGILLALVGLIPSIPAWLPFALFGIATLSGFIAGVGAPSFFLGKPILSVSAATTAASTSAILVELATRLPDTRAQGIVLVIAQLLAVAAGKSLPVPTKKA